MQHNYYSYAEATAGETMSVVTYEIAEAKAFGHRRLFDQSVQNSLGESEELARHNIYVFSLSEKVRYNLDNCFSMHHDVTSVQLKTAASLSGQFGFVLYHHWKPLATYFPTERDFDVVFESLRLDRGHTTESVLAFNLKFSGKDPIDFRIPVDLFLTVLDIEFGGHPEVVYVGQTFKLNRRFNTHEQLNRAASRLQDNEELRINLLTFKYGFGGTPGTFEPHFDQMWDHVLHKQQTDSQEYRDSISILERCLIHFYKPRYNTQHVTTPIHKDPLICDLLRTYGVRGVILGTGMNGYQWKFWSPNQAIETDEGGIVSYDFHNVDAKFTVGINPALFAA